MGEITRNHYFTVDLDKPLIRLYSGLLLASGDNNGDIFHFTLKRNGANVALADGVEFTAHFIRADDVTVYPECVNDNGVVHVTLDEKCYRCAGRFVLTVKSTVSGNTRALAIIDGYIRLTDTGNHVATEEEVVTLERLETLADGLHAPVKGTDYFTEEDKQSIVNDALSALAGADPSDAGYAELKGRTSNLESKTTNMAEDIAYLQRDVDNFTYSFIVLHHPLPAPEDPEKMSFVYTSWIADEDTSEWYDDITLMSPTGDVYAGRMIDGDPSQYTREKLATEKYVQNAMILTSPNGNRFRITVNDDGTLSTTPVT